MESSFSVVGNALKFTPPGGKITACVRVLENEAQVSVADTGPGIPNEVLSRIVAPYWQVQKTRTGTGLGPFIAKKIIEDHGEEFGWKVPWDEVQRFISHHPRSANRTATPQMRRRYSLRRGVFCASPDLSCVMTSNVTAED